MERLSQDIRHAMTRLLRDRGFAAITILTLAMGIGANTAVFSLVQTVMLKPLPYADPARVVAVWGPDRAEATHLSLQEVVNYDLESKTLAGVAGYQEFDANLTGGQEPERVRGGSATPNLFDVLGVPALIGRTFTLATVQIGTSDVLVIGHGLWQRRFGGAPDIIGHSVQVNGRARTVIGVMPPSFRMPNDYFAMRGTEVWIPEVVSPTALGAWGSRSYTGIGAASRHRHGGGGLERAAGDRRSLGEGRLRARAARRHVGRAGAARHSDPGIRHRRRARSPADPARLGRRWCCSLRAPMSRTCSSRGPACGGARWPCARRLAPDAAISFATCSPKACCSLAPAARRVWRWRGPASGWSSRCVPPTCRASTKPDSTPPCWPPPRSCRS